MSSLVETQAVSNEGLLSGTQKPSRIRKYETYAIWISVLSILYNIGEGVVAVFYGDNSDTLSLLFFGIQSFVEVTASVMVLWKVTYFRNKEQSKAQVEAERKLTTVIGIFFLLLSAGTVSSGLVALIRQDKPEETISTIIVSSVCIVLMYIQYVIKMKIANVLNSAVIKGDAKCAFACIQLTFIVFIGCGAYKLAPSGWWIDGVITVILGLIFLKDGIKTMKWAASKEFTGGCCGACGTVVLEKEKGGCQDKCCEDSDKGDCDENEQYNKIVDQEDPCCKSKSSGCSSQKKQEKVDTCCSSEKKASSCSSEKKQEKADKCCSSEKKQDKVDTCCSSEKKQEKADTCCSSEKKKDNCSSEKKASGCSSEKKQGKVDTCCSSEKKQEKVDTCCSSEKKASDCSSENKQEKVDTCCSSEKKEKKNCCSNEQKQGKEDKCCSSEKKQEKVDTCCSSEKKQEKVDTCCSSEKKQEKADTCCSSEKKDNCPSEKKASSCSSEKKQEKEDKCCSNENKQEKIDTCCSSEEKQEKADACCSGEKKDDCCSGEKKEDEPAEVEVKIENGEKSEEEE